MVLAITMLEYLAQAAQAAYPYSTEVEVLGPKTIQGQEQRAGVRELYELYGAQVESTLQQILETYNALH
jgi:hypothetical protein